MTERKGLGKKQRFEIFKRDSFTCQYCGRRPPEVMLEVDHISPVYEGGDNDNINLITSCHDCNSGKGKVKLEVNSPMPDASIESLSMQQEIAEMAMYSTLKTQRDSWIEKIIVQIQDHWIVEIGGNYTPEDRIIRRWLDWATPELIEKAINVTGSISASRRYGFHYKTEDAIRYCSGVMRSMLNQEVE